MKKLIEVKNLSKTYIQGGKNRVKALDNVSFDVNYGEHLAIIGQSGSGKSTLMNILGCLDVPTEGEYYLEGENVAALGKDRLSEIRNKKIGFIFQGFNLISEFDAMENVELPLMYAGIKKSEREKIAAYALERVGLSGRIHHRPCEMSGGQQQRVAIARAIAARPPLILADEPTGNLDSASGREIIAMLDELNRDGTTIIIITHDNKIAKNIPRVIRIMDGHCEDN